MSSNDAQYEAYYVKMCKLAMATEFDTRTEAKFKAVMEYIFKKLCKTSISNGALEAAYRKAWVKIRSQVALENIEKSEKLAAKKSSKKGKAAANDDEEEEDEEPKKEESSITVIKGEKLTAFIKGPLSGLIQIVPNDRGIKEMYLSDLIEVPDLPEDRHISEEGLKQDRDFPEYPYPNHEVEDDDINERGPQSRGRGNYRGRGNFTGEFVPRGRRGGRGNFNGDFIPRGRGNFRGGRGNYSGDFIPRGGFVPRARGGYNSLYVNTGGQPRFAAQQASETVEELQEKLKIARRLEKSRDTLTKLSGGQLDPGFKMFKPRK